MSIITAFYGIKYLTSCPYGHFIAQRKPRSVQMSRLSAFTAVAILTALAATPVSAQEVVRNPGAYASSNPDRDVLSGGAPTPAMKLSSDPPAMQAYAARESGIAKPTVSLAV